MTDVTEASRQLRSVSETVWDWRRGPARAPARPVLPHLARMLALMAVFGGLAWWRGHRAVAAGLAVYALLNVAAAAAFRPAFRWHARLWQRLGRAGGFLIGGALLTLFYYLVVTPAALVLRALGRRPLKVRFPGGEASYWADVESRAEAEADYRNQF